jgi:signal transduction histidine kinase
LKTKTPAEQKRAPSRKPKREALERVLNSVPTGILSVDTDGVCRIINEAARHILNIPSGSSIGKPISNIVESKHLGKVLSEALECAIRNKPFCRELTIQGKLFDAQAMLIRDAGAEDQVLMILEDVSLRKEAQNKKDEFLALISHELRTPLTVIKGYLEIISNGMMGDTTPQLAECFDVMHSHCSQLETLIRDLIRFGMLSRGQFQAVPESITLFPFLKAFGQSIKPRLRPERITISLVVPDPQITCLCDPEHLKDALRHLVDNAVKFSAKGRNIQICATKFDPSDLPPKESGIIREAPSSHKKWVKFEVVDEGTGIASENLKDIFNSFQQVESYMTRSSRGLGLGLALVKEIVKAYDGTLWIKSTPGKGTNVAFLMPGITMRI